MPINLLESGFEKRHIFFDADAHPDVRESIAYLIPLPQHGLGVIFYTYVHAVGEDGKARAGSTVIAYGPALPEPVFEVSEDIFVDDSMTFEDWRVGPGAVSMDDAMTKATISFAGKEISLDASWQALNPSFGFGPNRNGCPQWLAWDRTEQGGHYTGTLTIGDTTIDLDNSGHRDHSWGMRDWGGATHWKWWNIIGPDETAIHLMDLQAFGRTTLHGYVQKDRAIGTILDYDADIEFDARMMHIGIQLSIRDDEGRTTQVQLRQGADLVWPVSPNLLLHEASMFATVDGRDGVGYIECAWPPSYIEFHRTEHPQHQRDQTALTLDRK